MNRIIARIAKDTIAEDKRFIKMCDDFIEYCKENGDEYIIEDDLGSRRGSFAMTCCSEDFMYEYDKSITDALCKEYHLNGDELENKLLNSPQANEALRICEENYN